MSRSHRAVFLLARGVQSAKAPLLHNRHSCLVHARCVPFITTLHKHLTPSILTCHHLESHHITSIQSPLSPATLVSCSKSPEASQPLPLPTYSPPRATIPLSTRTSPGTVAQNSQPSFAQRLVWASWPCRSFSPWKNHGLALEAPRCVSNNNILQLVSAPSLIDIAKQLHTTPPRGRHRRYVL